MISTNYSRWQALCSGIAALMLTPSAYAGISVSPSVVILAPKAKQEATITVTNDGTELAYVTVEPREVMARGENDEKLRADKNPETLGLLTTPARLVLDGRERRTIRLLPTTMPGNEDRVWRVKIAPVAGKIKGAQSGVAFLVGYDALIIQRAVNPASAVTAKRNGKELTVSNAGSSYAMVTAVRHCAVPGACTDLKDSKRLYGGRSWTKALPIEGGSIEIDYLDASEKPQTIKL